MKPILTITTLILLFASCRKELVPSTSGTAPAIPWRDSSNTHPMNDVYARLITKYNKLGLPGISLLVNDKFGTWVGAAGKADIGQNIEFVPGQISKIASVTKLMIGTLFFKLMEDSLNSGIGYNALSTAISQWVPSYQLNKVANGDKVTLGQLLNHESGIPELTEEDDFYLAVLNSPNKRWNQDELLSFVKGSPAVFAPGDTAIYSNTNYLLLSVILDKLSNGNHAKLLSDKIFKPLGMEHSYYQPHDNLPPDIAQGYYDLYRNHTLINVSNYITGSGNGFGGVFSNVPDMFIFLDALLIKKTFLSEKSLKLMNRFGKSDGTNRYGYGLMKKFIERGDNAGLGHSGRDLGYTANLFYFPAKKISHAFLINYGTDADSYLKETFRQFQNELLDITLHD
jgi:D-alanyl-D-alanine carboxypeptidase